MRRRVLRLSIILVASVMLSGCASGVDVAGSPEEIPPMPKWEMLGPPYYSKRSPENIEVAETATPQEAARQVLRELGASLPFWQQTGSRTYNARELSPSTRAMIESQVESLPLTVIQAYTAADAGRPTDLWADTKATGWWLAVVGDLDLSAAYWVAREEQSGPWKYYPYHGSNGPLFKWFGATATLVRPGLCDEQLAQARLYILNGTTEFLACQAASGGTWVVLSRHDGFPLQFPDTRGWVGESRIPAERLIENLE